MPSATNPRVVVDTGVLISAYAFGGIPAQAVRRVFQEAQVWVSPDLLEEYREVPLQLLREQKISHDQWRALVVGIATFCTRVKLIHPRKKLSICRDPEDDMVLECCRSARARFLITGDKDLLEIRQEELEQVGLRRLRILRPRAFLEQWEKRSADTNLTGI